MKHRAIKNLIQLNNDEFFREISIGLEKIYESCIGLKKSCDFLASKDDFRGARIMRYIAKEEAAKFLILLDAIRCPRGEQKYLSRQLDKFNEHLAKGVYADVCEWCPSTYSELCGYIEREIEQYYLDGPEGVELIFRNSIISRREESMYVDYVKFEDNTHEWITPVSSYDIGISTTIQAVTMVQALRDSGVSSYESLKLFSGYWGEYEFCGDTHYQDFKQANSESLSILEGKGLLKDVSEDVFALLINSLPFPLYKEKIKENKVSIDELIEIQKNRGVY